MPSDSLIQVPPDSTGSKVATRKITSPGGVDSAGSVVADVAVHQQIVSLADRRGDDYQLAEWQGEVLAELHAMRELLEAISSQLS